MFFVVPEKRKYAAPEAHEETFGFMTVFTSPLFRRVAPLTMTSQASFLSVSGLWAGTWLQDVAGLERAQAANVLAGMTVAMIAGFVVLGSVTSALGRKGVSTFTTATLCVVTAAVPLVLLIILEGDAPPWVCWTLFGFFGTGSILYYAALSQHFPKQIAGRVNTAMNLLVFVGAFLLQWGIGVVIDHWSAVDEFSVTGYRVALSVLVALQALALLWYLLFRREQAVAVEKA